ncbi:hypothetical protein, partial [Gluconacetobacter entanii]|uniref:hypothetical protein n=1 Tax=Gluconacetobacter entanii TaxID=108528 RepID=UPI00223649E5
PSLLFFQHPYDLLFRKTTAFHSSVSFSIGLYFKMVTFPGGTSNWVETLIFDAGIFPCFSK